MFFPRKLNCTAIVFPIPVAERIAQDDRIKFLRRLPAPRVDLLITENEMSDGRRAPQLRPPIFVNTKSVALILRSPAGEVTEFYRRHDNPH